MNSVHHIYRAMLKHGCNFALESLVLRIRAVYGGSEEHAVRVAKDVRQLYERRNDPIASIDLDFVADSRPESEYGVTFELLEEDGPAGGNPLYRCTGRLSDLRAWICTRYCQVTDINGGTVGGATSELVNLLQSIKPYEPPITDILGSVAAAEVQFDPDPPVLTEVVSTVQCWIPDKGWVPHDGRVTFPQCTKPFERSK